MWPFDLFDNSPEWVKARRKRHNLIEELVMNNVPNILKMPLDYEFMFHKPMKTEFICERYLIDRTILERKRYFLGLKRFGGVGDSVGVCLIYYIITEHPIKECKGYNYNKMYFCKDYRYFFQENELEVWEKELYEQLPSFFKYCNEDIKKKLYNYEVEKKVDKELCNQSVDRTSSIIECLRLKL